MWRNNCSDTIPTLAFLILPRDVVDIILSTGFDINVRTARGTALHEAGICGKIEVVAALLEAGINMELRDQDDRTVLEIMDELKTPRTREVIHLILGKKPYPYFVWQKPQKRVLWACFCKQK